MERSCFTDHGGLTMNRTRTMNVWICFICIHVYILLQTLTFSCNISFHIVLYKTKCNSICSDHDNKVINN